MDQVSRRGESGQEPASGLFFAEVVIPNKKGLHARASAQFVRCASSFTATVRVTREGHTVGGTSIMGLMMLAAAPGTPAARALVVLGYPDIASAADAAPHVAPHQDRLKIHDAAIETREDEQVFDQPVKARGIVVDVLQRLTHGDPASVLPDHLIVL